MMDYLPKGWIKKPIGDVCDIKRGMSWSKDLEVDNQDLGVPVLRIPNIQNVLMIKDLKYLKDISEKNIEKYKVTKGYSVMVGSNGNKNRVGNCCYIEKDMEFVFASFLIACVANDDIEDKFLYYTLKAYPIQTAISNDAASSTGLHNISLKLLRKQKILSPPLSEQQKIAEILSTVDEAIEKTATIIEETRQLKKGLMQKLFTEGIGHTRFKETKIGKIPEEWEVVITKDISTLITDGSHYSPEPQDKGEHFIATVKDIKENGLNKRTCIPIQKEDYDRLVKGNCKPKNGSVILTKDGTVGNSLVWNYDDQIVLLSSIAIFSLNDEYIIPKFLKYFFDSPINQSWLKRLMGGTALQRVILRDLRKITVPLPSLEEQNQIASILSEVDAKIEKEEATKAELEQLKKGLMQVLLTGKVRVKVEA